MRNKILSSVIMMLLSISAWALSSDPPPPVPPPPGLELPIDDNIYLLATAGLALGICFLRIRKIS